MENGGKLVPGLTVLVRAFSICILLGVMPLSAVDTFASEGRSAQRWSVSLDNDLFSAASHDRDYTGGFSLVYLAPVSNHSDAFDRLTDRLHDSLSQTGSSRFRGLEVGGFGFTPADTAVAQPQPLDRPYASFVYLSAIEESIAANEQYGLTSRLTVGVMGLDWISDIQGAIHEATDGTLPRGWENQVSSGGEPTAQYALHRQNRVDLGREDIQLKQSFGLKLGYISEIEASAGMRIGKLKSPWWSFKPEQTSYSLGAAGRSALGLAGERFFWFGLSVRARWYNALVQGQFRDSAVTFSASDLRPLILETWAGVTTSLGHETQISYELRAHTSEFRDRALERPVVWGGLTFTQHFR